MKRLFHTRCTLGIAAMAVVAGVAMAGSGVSAQVVAASVANAPVSGRVAQPACAVSYTVVKGDSWWTISQKAGQKLSAVLKANKATTKTKLLVGKNVCLPKGSKTTAAVVPVQDASTCEVTYKTVRNDSWSRIAQKKKVTLQELLKINGATTKTKIFVGDVLCLPKGAVKTAETRTGLVLPPPAKVYSAKKSKQIIRDVFPDRLEERALAIAQRESRMNAAGYNWCCVGLFQINWWSHSKWLADMGVTAPEMLLDAQVNAEAALALYKRSSGWGPWE